MVVKNTANMRFNMVNGSFDANEVRGMYVIKNNLTDEYYSDEGFDVLSNTYFYDTYEDAKSELDNLVYYYQHDKDELSILKVTFKLVEVQKWTYMKSTKNYQIY